MKIITPSVEIRPHMPWLEMQKHIEICGRECYKSEGYITEDSYQKFIRNLIKNHHEAVLEHGVFTVKFICDRGVSHEIVRHRMASYCQESTRYCTYTRDRFGNEITVIKPIFFREGTYPYIAWKQSCLFAEEAYNRLIEEGCKAEEARAVLPNSLKTEIVMTANVREWRHFLKLRCDKTAHPQMREIAVELLSRLNEYAPTLFEDIYNELC